MLPAGLGFHPQPSASRPPRGVAPERPPWLDRAAHTPLETRSRHPEPPPLLKTLRSIAATQRLCFAAPTPRVLVPTMGALHAGHAALLHRARRLAGPKGTVVATVFVNPTQFGPKEDLSRYPRPFAQDRALCQSLGVDLLFAPDPASMYAPDASTWVEETSVSRGLCGASRPGHFRGVATVVLKLFQITQPSHAVFGQKDFQQCAVLQRMVRDLNLPVRLFLENTVREPDGLALSSRNLYLSPQERAQAVILSQSLRAAQKAFRAGTTSAARLQRLIEKTIATAPLAQIDYISIVDGSSLEPVRTVHKGCVAALAVFFGRTRLIDNLRF
jgi:pantoate--beta-alanine ligase